MLLISLTTILCIVQLAFPTLGSIIASKPKNIIRQETGYPHEDLVTWDNHSLFIRGERIVFYSGEFHPFRLPVTDLWLDVFQKVKALGYNGVSFYVDWALVEGTPGIIRADGIFALEPFFEAASQAGIYLLARPGPYINAEASGGGFPGWLSRIKGTLRSNDTDYLSATDLYASTIAQKIVQAQITNGGPVILYQVENEYTFPYGDIIFPNLNYFDYVINQGFDPGVRIPIINNDAAPLGLFAPGNASFGNVTVDIYGHDSYPLGFDCSHPYNWPDNDLPTNYRQLHEQQSPSTPYTIVEFQGGSFDPWGGPGFEQCVKLLNSQFERVFYKNNWAFGVKMYNQYMIFGGTNWGNLGHPGGYTSYDYAAAIAEDRNVAREKYSEAKLEANFLRVSPAYITSLPDLMYTNGTYADTDAIATTRLTDTQSNTRMYVIRHSAYNSNDSTSFRFTVSTSMGNITIPQLSNFSSTLSLDGRDSKLMVSDYAVNQTNLIYSSAEIFTHMTYGQSTTLVLYGGMDETHEFAVSTSVGTPQLNGSKVVTQVIGNTSVVQWQVTPDQQTATVGNLTVYLLWRNDAYNWWDIELPAPSPISNFTSPSKQRVLVKGPYLVRTAELSNNNLYVVGEINATTTMQIVEGPTYDNLFFNGVQMNVSGGQAVVEYTAPQVNLPDLSSLTWNTLDTLPELSSSYSDDLWPVGNHTTTNNPLQPTSQYVLYASDYGFHTGPLLYRGHFTTPSSNESLTLSLETQGGYAYGYQVYLNETLIHNYPGVSTSQNDTASITLPTTQASTPYTFTIVIDHTGLNENFNPGLDSMKYPRGIISYNLTSGTSNSTVPLTWKLTGNFGGENYPDLSRGPYNEDGFYFSREGYQLPGAPTSTSQWSTTPAGPMTGFNTTAGGAYFYSVNFTLSLPANSYDIPLQLTFTNTSSPSDSSSPAALRCNLYINGYQFGKYINNIGPQVSFPVPEGILNYAGQNYLGVYLWNLEPPSSPQGAEMQVRLANLTLESSSTPTFFGQGARRVVALSDGSSWRRRPGAY